MTIAIPITPETITLCANHNEQAQTALIEELLNEEAEEVLASICEPYCQDPRGTVMDFSINIGRESLSINKDLTGSACI